MVERAMGESEGIITLGKVYKEKKVPMIIIQLQWNLESLNTYRNT